MEKKDNKYETYRPNRFTKPVTKVNSNLKPMKDHQRQLSTPKFTRYNVNKLPEETVKSFT